MIENFLINPFLALILVAISSSLLGVFVLWKKLSYFGDALSHSMLLGLMLGAITKTNEILAVVSFAILFAFLVRLISKNNYFSKDTIIMILSYFCVAMSVILSDFWFKDFAFSSYIFGDVLAVQNRDILLLFVVTFISIIYSIFAFKKILLININRDLAKIDGINIEIWEASFLVLLSLVIALSVQIVGVLLMTALLILPSVISRIFSGSAKSMMLGSILVTLPVTITSFKFATIYDLTISSVVVVTFFMVFVFSLGIKKIYDKS